MVSARNGNDDISDLDVPVGPDDAVQRIGPVGATGGQPPRGPTVRGSATISTLDGE
jgi:hypothetical protein